MKKRLVAFIFTLILITSIVTVNAATAVENVIGQRGDYVILATITDVHDGSFDLSKEYVISPKDANLPSTISVEKFRYSYCSEHSESYNNPQIGDNVILNLTMVNGKLTVGVGAYRVDTVSYKSLKVLVPFEMKGYPCASELIALAYYIRSDGTKTEYKYENNKVYALPSTLISDFESDYISYYSNNIGGTSSDVIKEVTIDSIFGVNGIWIPVSIILTILLAGGAVAVIIINKKIINK